MQSVIISRFLRITQGRIIVSGAMRRSPNCMAEWVDADNCNNHIRASLKNIHYAKFEQVNWRKTVNQAMTEGGSTTFDLCLRQLATLHCNEWQSWFPP